MLKCGLCFGIHTICTIARWFVFLNIWGPLRVELEVCHFYICNANTYEWLSLPRSDVSHSHSLNLFLKKHLSWRCVHCVFYCISKIMFFFTKTCPTLHRKTLCSIHEAKASMMQDYSVSCRCSTIWRVAWATLCKYSCLTAIQTSL